MKSRIYTGHVMHARMEPVQHRFQYPLYMYAFDLDELNQLDRDVAWFGYNRFAPVAIHDRDYLHEGEEPIREKLQRYLDQYNCGSAIHRIELVTTARYFHYVFNPVSFYYCYKQDGGIACIVAEVNNTFQERHVYVLEGEGQLQENQLRRYTRPKSFHVSPFNDMRGDYDFYFGNVNGALEVRINILREQRPVFYTRLSGRCVPLTSSNLWKTILRYPLTAWFSMPRILKEAAMLHYQKHLPVYSKPHPTSEMTIRVAKPNFFENLAKKTLAGLLQNIGHGSLQMKLPDQTTLWFGTQDSTPTVNMKINDYRFFSKILKSGDIGLGESYVDGDWDTQDLAGFISFLIHNKPSMEKAALGSGIWGRNRYRIKHWFNKNTPSGSRKNIHDHYDIGNEFYRRILDPSMSYSSAYFESPDDDLETAQKNKMRRLIEKARIQAEDHVLEIGGGWGGMAMEMAKTTGCRVTTITVSEEQYKLASERIQHAGLGSRIHVRLCDYRNIQGQYDKIVSIEMIEAVGHEYLGTFFAACDRALKPNGIIALQAITIPDQRYDAYRKRSDWIQQYIFPGAVVPSLTALCEAMTERSTLIVEHLENIGEHYAKTLRIWRERLNHNQQAIELLGMDERFVRTWNYYFAYCEAAFAARYLNNLQLVLTRQKNPSLENNEVTMRS